MGLPENYYPTRHLRSHQLDRPEQIGEYRPAEAAAIDEEPVLCFDPVNVAWVRHIVGALHDLTDFRIWKGTDSQKRHAVQQIEQFLNSLKACQVCEDCPEPEPGTEQPGAGGSSDGIGESGYTIEELEEMLQMAVTKIEWRNGELWYRDGCCDWYKVGGEGGAAAPIVPTTPPSDMTVDEWIDAGRPPIIPDLPSPETHENPAYTTIDSVKCAKATALVLKMKEAHDDLLLVLGALTFTNLTVAGLSAVAAGYFASAGTAAVIEMALVLYAGISSIGGDNLIEGIEDEIALELGPVICNLTPKMQEGTTVRDGDVEELFLSWATYTPTMPGAARTAMEVLPISYWKAETQPEASSVECGCGLYLPHDYTPPATSGVISFSRMVGVSGTLAIPTGPSGLPFEQIDSWSALGSKTGATAFRSQYQGVASSTYYAGMGILLYCPEVITINEIAAAFDVSNTAGTGQLKMIFRIFDEVAGWTATGGAPLVVNNTNDQTLRITGQDVSGQWIYLFLQALASNQPNIRIDIPDILFTGQIGGVGFLDKGIGDILA